MPGLGELIEQHLEPAYAVARAVTGSAADAEDAVSTAVTRLLAHPERYDASRPFFPYFARSVANAARTQCRAARRRAAHEENAMARNGSRPAAEEPGRGEARTLVRRALGALPPGERAAVVLTHLEGLSQDEAGEVLGVPQRTVSRRAQRGLERMRAALGRAGFVGALAPALVASAAREPVPGLLAGHVQGLVSGAPAAGKASINAAAAAAKGGIAMKIVAGLVAAGALAGAVAVSTGALSRDGGGGPLASPGAGGNGKPAPVNPYNGMQEREEVFEFAQKPSAKKEDEKWVISFASKAACDATVSIVGPDGRVVRHLASGVLGANAPHPFQQNTLSQKLEWNGLTDTFQKAPAGCRVRVSLGLKAEFDRNLLWDPHDLPPYWPTSKVPKRYFLASAKDGTRYVGGSARNGCIGRAYDKAGKYLYTFFPPKAAELEKLMKPQCYKFTTTTWGDKVIIPASQYGFTGYAPGNPRVPKIHPSKLPVEARHDDLIQAIKAQPGAGEVKLVEAASVGLPAAGAKIAGKDPSAFISSHTPRLAVDRVRDELYLVSIAGHSLFRANGKTGEFDKSFFPDGSFNTLGEVDIGPDGLIYVRTGPFAYGHWLFRVTRDGKPVPFAHNAEDVEAAHAKSRREKGRVGGPPRAFAGKGLTAIYAGTAEAHSNIHEKGFDVAYNGNIVTTIDPVWEQKKCAEWMKKHGLVHPDGKPYPRRYYYVVWDADGKLLSANAIRDAAPESHSVHMDRDGNIYAAQRGVLPAANKCVLSGMTDLRGGPKTVGYGSLVKFRGRGGAFPVGLMPSVGAYHGKPTPNLPPPPDFADSIELANYHGKKGRARGALWAYGGLTTICPGCNCCHLRHDQDGWTRTWIPSSHLFSVVVLDANGNLIARIGRYGNVDDADEKCAGIHMSWPRIAAVSDEALYVMDNGNLRIFRCRLGYAAEEELPLP